MTLLPIMMLLCLPDSNLSKQENCEEYLSKMVMGTKAYSSVLKRTQSMYQKCERISVGVYAGPLPSTDSNRYMPHSPSYDICCHCDLSYDETVIFESFSFDPATNKLYLSENVGETARGEHKIRFIKQVRYKKKWLKKFRECEGKTAVPTQRSN